MQADNYQVRARPRRVGGWKLERNNRTAENNQLTGSTAVVVVVVVTFARLNISCSPLATSLGRPAARMLDRSWQRAECYLGVVARDDYCVQTQRET